MLFKILLLLLLYFLIIKPAFRIWSAYRNARRQMRDMQDAFRRATGNTGAPDGAPQDDRRSGNGRKAGWSTPVQKPKKIDPTTGEYVKFQEVTVTETTQSASSGHASAKNGSSQGSSSQSGSSSTETGIITEEQITDITWEDIK